MNHNQAVKDLKTKQSTYFSDNSKVKLKYLYRTCINTSVQLILGLFILIKLYEGGIDFGSYFLLILFGITLCYQIHLNHKLQKYYEKVAHDLIELVLYLQYLPNTYKRKIR